jgi:protein TonB
MVCANPMFGAFEVRTDADATRRYTITTGIALVVLVGLAGAAVAFSGGEKEKEEEPEVIDVTFQAPAEEAAPPPPPPPPAPVNRPKPRSDAPRPPSRAPETPTKLTEERLEEADESRFQMADTGGDGSDMVAGSEVGMVGGIGKVELPPPPPRPRKEKVAKTGPIQMPENATPPRPVGGNAPPAYPEEARASGVEGEVYLKIVINEDGSVGDIEVKKGEEPFVSAAIAAVKSWKYTPALLDGKPITVFRIIKVPFKLKA